MASSNTNPGTITDKVQQLTIRSEKAREQSIRLKQQLESAERDLKEAEKEAEEKFGTADLDELRKVYKEMRDRNASALADFESSLVSAEKLIQETQGQLAALENK